MTSANSLPVRILVALGACTAALAATPAAAGDSRGPVFGRNRYVTSIRNLPGELDTDDYVAPLAKGDRITVRVTPSATSSFAPTLAILGPDGASRTVPILARGRFVEVREFAADATGEWTVRVGASGTGEGEYVVQFATSPTTSLPARRVALTGDPPAASLPFEAVDGTVADVRVTWRKGAGAAPVSLLAPSGDDLLARPENAGRVRTRSSSSEIRGLELRGGHGTYVLRLGALAADAREVVVSVKLRPPAPVAGGKKPTRLSDVEPCLDLRPEPILGVAGRAVRLHGSSLVPGVRVYFGDAEASSVTCFPGDFDVDAVPPAAAPGSLVTVSAVQPDGQACVRPGYFLYAPVPRIDAVTDLAGSAADGWSTSGGLALRISGAGFRPGARVGFPGHLQTTPSSMTATEILVTSPAGPAGTDFLSVVDEFGQVGRSARRFEMKPSPAFAASPYSPPAAAPGASVALTLTGSGFELADVVLVDGSVVASTMQGTTTRKATLPPLARGMHAVSLRDRLGVVVPGPDFQVKGAAHVDSVAAAGGPSLGAGEIPASGGTVVRVDGEDFGAGDVVRLGGTTVTKLPGATATSFRFVAPAGPVGDAALEIADVLGQTTTVGAAIRYVGFDGATADRLPPPDGLDDFGAETAVLGDVDGDGAPDLVLASPAGSFVGSRSELLRILRNDGSGAFTDATDQLVPGLGSDATGSDDWNARGLALGDLDGDGDLDLVAAGDSPDPWTTSGVRFFENVGSGAFALDDARSPATTCRSTVYAYDEWGWGYAVTGARDPRGSATCAALGDLDGDGDLDLVVGRDDVESELEIVDPAYVDFTREPPFVSYLDVWYHTIHRTRFFPGTRVLRNDLADGGGFADVSAGALPSAGTAWDEPGPLALAARDLALADLDGDGDLDLVVAWDDPRSVTSAGLAAGDRSDAARVATRVLLNDGGAFADATGSWMPAGAAAEWWQADEIEVADLDGDGDGDLLLVCEGGLGAWQGSAGDGASALRVLRNDGDRFVSVTTAVLPGLAAGDDLRGGALAVRDVDGDGTADLLLATSQSLAAGGQPLRSTRLLLNSASFRFTESSAYLPPAAIESGQADALLLGDLDGSGGLSLLLVGDEVPDAGEYGALLRVLDWVR